MATKPYCTAPWTGLIVRETGDVSICCASRLSLGNIRSKSIIEIIQSPLLEDIKKDIQVGKYNSNCSVCYQHGKNSGTTSLRNKFNIDHPDISKGLQFLDIRWNNLCNLYCVYCGPRPSSTWEDKLNRSQVKTLKNDYDEELERWVLSKSDQITELMLAGGEPLLMKQNYNLISKLPSTSKLSVITNLAYDLEKNPIAKLLLDRPANTTSWSISVENYGDKFEYIRTGADWEQFKNNLGFLVKHATHNISLLMVYGIFSALNLMDTIKFYHNLGIKKIEIGMIVSNPALDIFKFPKEILMGARDQLIGLLEWQKETYGVDFELYKCRDVELILTKLDEMLYNNTYQTISKTTFISEIEKYDRWTKNKFSDVWIDEYKLILQSLK